MKKVSLYIMTFLYIVAGVVHLFLPAFYLTIMPSWLPLKMLLIYGSGMAEIVLALLLLPKQTRRIAAQLIMVMLVVYLFIIHIPQSVDFYKTGNKYLLASLIRIPLQFLLLAWAQVYTRKGI
jgi:uncharacterized membrane protein